VGALATEPLYDVAERERFQHVVIGDDPAAGNEPLTVVPGGRSWVLLAYTIALVTDATVINRHPELLIDDGTTAYCRIGTGAAQAASITGRYNYAVGLGTFYSASNILTHGLPSPPLKLPGGHRIRFSTVNLQAGDNYGAPILYVEELPERGERSQLEYELLGLLRRLTLLDQYAPAEGT